MGNKQDYNYFDAFVKLVDYSCDAAKSLNDTLEKFNVAELSDKIKYMHQIEHSADIEKHEMMKRLIKEFLPPIEREDIMSIAQEIDDVTDAIEDVLIRIYMFNIASVRKEALEFSNIIVRCCNALKSTMVEFAHFRKSDSIHKAIVEINYLEEEGDRLYTEAVHNLYTNCKDPIEIMAWTETFDRFEKCCDACEEVANEVESVIMKNS